MSIVNGFHEVHFPLRLALGATGGPQHKTEVLTLAGGGEVRNALWASARRHWDVGGTIGDLADLHALIRFFKARRGRLYGFRFRDPMDHTSTLPGAKPAARDQKIATGNGKATVFRLIKDYDGISRRIIKPVANSVLIDVDGRDPEGWSVDTRTGWVRFNTPPARGAVIRAGFTFDCAVRFESDQMEGVIETFGAGRVVSVGLVELLST